MLPGFTEEEISMRKLMVVVGIGITAVAAAACSGGGGGGGGTLTSGTYVVSNPATNPDGCAIDGQIQALDGATFTVTVDSAAHTVSAGGIDYTQSGSSLTSADVGQDIDFNPNADCVVHQTQSSSAQITGNDKAHVTLGISATMVSGTQCTNPPLPFTLPCTSTATFDLTKQ
jgi:hypothetical protein